MLSVTPASVRNLSAEDKNKEILRLGIIAELDAISLYEQLATETGNSHIAKTLLDIAKEEKTHAGEFQFLLLQIDEEQKRELVEGQKEVEKLAAQNPRCRICGEYGENCGCENPKINVLNAVSFKIRGSSLMLINEQNHTVTLANGRVIKFSDLHEYEMRIVRNYKMYLKAMELYRE